MKKEAALMAKEIEKRQKESMEKQKLIHRLENDKMLSSRATRATTSSRATRATTSSRATRATTSSRATRATTSSRATRATTSSRATRATTSSRDDAPPPEPRPKRTRAKKTQYLLKCNCYKEEESTWEPVENLDCEELSKTFEENRKEKEKTAKKPEDRGKKRVRESSEETSTSRKGRGPSVSFADEHKETKRAKEDKTKSGFDKGLKVKKILGASDTTGELMFLIKWADSDKNEFVPAKVANVKCPQQVIAFYEKRLIWITPADAE